MYTSVTGTTLPVYLDSTVVGIVLNTIALIIGSACTQVTVDEKEARHKLFIVPEEEKDPIEVKKTQSYLKAAILFGAAIAIILLIVWGFPVSKVG